MTSTLTSVLTTTFSIPASCSTSWTYEGQYYNSIGGGLLIQNACPNFDVNCFPPQYTGNGRAPNNPTQLFSPGACPDGYITWAVGGSDGLSTGGAAVGTCCLRGFSYMQTVSSQNFGNTTLLYQGCASTYPAQSGSTVVANRVGQCDLTTTTITGPITMWAQPLYVEYRKQDLSLFSTSSPTTTTTSSSSAVQPSSAASSAISAPTSSSSNGSDTNPSNNGLSTGAKAAIGVGAALGALVILSAIFFSFMRSRRSNKQRQPNPWPPHQPGFNRNEIDGSEAYEKPPVASKYFVFRKPVLQETQELE